MQKAEIYFIHDDEKIAKLTIGANYSYESQEETLQNASHSINLSNVPLVTYPNNRTPLQYLSEPSQLGIASLLLLEETDYQIQLSISSSIPDSDINLPFRELLEHNKDKTLQLKEWFLDESASKREYRGSLRFSSYVGKTQFDIDIAGKSCSPLLVEVRSKKMGYLEQYPLMLSEIASFASALLLQKGAPTHSVYRFNDKRRTVSYEDFMFLEYLFQDEHLPQAYEYMRRTVHSTLHRISDVCPLEHARSIDPSFLPDIFCASNLSATDNALLAYISNNLHGFVPLATYQVESEDTTDIPENRLVKELLLAIEELILTLQRSTYNDGYIGQRLESYYVHINEYLADDWLKEVGRQTYIPTNSQLLQKREGYRDLFHYYLCFDLAFSLASDDLGDVLKGGNKKLYDIYEYWCYISLLSVMENVAKLDSSREDNELLKKTDSGWSLELRHGKGTKRTYSYNYEGMPYLVHFFYNKTFSRRSHVEHSYSLEFRPDYSLCIEMQDGAIYFIHFDAKYRSRYEIDDTLNEEAIEQSIEYMYWRTDVEKMHTYKDALSHTLGAYILYPGTKTKSYTEYKHEVLPSVGAISLVPGDTVSRSILEMFIRERIEYAIKLHVRMEVQ